MKQAVIDLGTNTFHLLIVETDGAAVKTRYRESLPAKIGQAGINQNRITEAAMQRAVEVLTHFRRMTDTYNLDPATVNAIGTSAIRMAENQADFIERVQTQTGFQVTVISGDEEAAYIYQGVRAAGALDDEMALIMDIGGGSVEFILGNKTRIFWKQSFEIGAQRLIERFWPTTQEAIRPATIQRLHGYFQEQLLPLTNAVHQYQPTVLVGSSGSFDTLVDIWLMQSEGRTSSETQTAYTLPMQAFREAYRQITIRSRAERQQLPGMIDLRVDLIVVGVCLIDFVLNSFGIPAIRVSSYSLREGVAASFSAN